MKYNIKAIPTEYRGSLFRSRLEARWAAFFDLCGWKWCYEPVDFNGWVPDFAIYGFAPVYVEVKPVIDFPGEVASEIDASGCTDECLIVGQCCPLPCSSDDEVYFGWLRQTIEGRHCWDRARFGAWYDSLYRFGFCHSEQSFVDRISGEYNGACGGGEHLMQDEPKYLWNMAGNRSQWKPKPKPESPTAVADLASLINKKRKYLK